MDALDTLDKERGQTNGPEKPGAIRTTGQPRSIPSIQESAERAMAMLAPRGGMTYEQRSEFERLKTADVSQGKRIADQIATIAALRAALVEACDMLMMQPERRAELQALGWSEVSRIAELRKLADGDA